MSDIPGVPSAIGIEAVERLSHGEAGVLVRVSGRWRRRRPDWRGPAMLVLEIEGQRHRVPAMPEPPSLAGILPGTWRMSFSVPAELAAELDSARAWLQLGMVMAPLTLPQAPGTEAARIPVDPSVLAARELRTFEVAAQSARRRADEAEARAAALQGEVARLETELAYAREEPERARAQLAERERDLRLARQALHAEAAERGHAEARVAAHELEIDRLHARAREASGRTHELEHELRAARRAVDEARHELESARAQASGGGPLTRASAEHGLLPSALRPHEPASPPERPGLPARLLEAELGLVARRLADAPLALAAETLPAAGAPEADSAARGEADAARARADAARGEADAARAEASAARAELTAARAELGAARQAAADSQSAVASLQEALERSRRSAAEEREARLAAEATVRSVEHALERQRERSVRALQAVRDFRAELERLRADPAAFAPAPAEPGVEAERLRAALERLRERHPAGEEPAHERPPGPGPGAGDEPAGPADATAAPEAEESIAAPSAPPVRGSDLIPRVFRRLAREDPAAAGRMLIGLLPAQHLVHPRPLAYDLVLGPATTLQVTVAARSTSIRAAPRPRDPEETQLRVIGDEAALGRLLAAGALRRRLAAVGRRAQAGGQSSHGLARPTGAHAVLEAVRRLTTAPPPITQLLAAEATLDPPLALNLAARLIDTNPAAPRGFVLEHRRPSGDAAGLTLQVPEVGHPIVTALAPAVTPGTSVVCAPDRLLPALLGARGADIVITGDERPLDWLRGRFEHA